MARPKKAKVIKTTESAEVVLVEPKLLPVQQERESSSVESFISKAIEQNLPVETMERLLAMRKDLKAEHAKEAFIASMAKFQSECPVITKDTIVKDKYGKERYRYAALDSIVKQVKEPLGRNGFSYTIDVKNADSVITAMCKITHILGHSEVSSFEAPIDKDAYMSAPQKYGAASTFAKRYAFQNALGILTGDEDTNAADLPGGAAAPEEPKAPATPAKTPTPDANNPVFANYKKQLQEAKSMDELQKVWANMPLQAKTALASLKDEIKAMITTESPEQKDENIAF